VSILAELWDFVKTRKKFWLIPILLVMLILGTLLILSETTALAPFLYTIF
jgi:competence protein ComGC